MYFSNLILVMNYEILLGFIFATAALSISPGPDNIFVLTQSIANGKKYGFATIAGLMTGCLIHTSLLAFGVSTIIKNNETVFLIIKLFGVSYLLYLSYSVFKVTIFFLAFFPGFLFSETMNTVWQFYILGFVFIATSTVVFGIIAILAGVISNYIIKTPKAGLFLKWLQIVVFVGIAFYLLLSE